MPVYNESRTLRTIVGLVLDSPVDLELEVICVNDGSSDGSLEILHELAAVDDRIVVIDQPINMGKGKAIRTAIEHMTGDIAIVQDADLEYDPSEYPKVIQPIIDGRADAVFGSRFAASEQRRVLFFWHALGNRVLTLMANMANDVNLTDMETCYKAVRSDILKRLRFTSDRFGFEPEITARLSQWGARIYEVPISYHGRTYAEGKNIGWRDGIEALWLIVKFRFIDSRATNEDSVVTRQSLGSAPRFRRWVLEQFNGHVGVSILEVNAGPGHTTSHLLESENLVVTDSDPVHVGTLQRRFGHLENIDVKLFDPNIEVFENGELDTALLLDGLQRAEEPKQLLSNVAQCLQSGAKILIQVPADTKLYGPTDEAAGHLRRFEQDELTSVLHAAGLEIVEVRPFNRFGRLGWKLHHGFGAGRISFAEARFFDLVVPMARRFDALSTADGLSYIAIARVP